MTPQEKIKQSLDLLKEIVAIRERMLSHMAIRRKELFIAMKSNDPEKIEAARQASVDTFSAFLDEFIRVNRNVMLLHPE